MNCIECNKPLPLGSPINKVRHDECCWQSVRSKAERTAKIWNDAYKDGRRPFGANHPDAPPMWPYDRAAYAICVLMGIVALGVIYVCWDNLASLFQ